MIKKKPLKVPIPYKENLDVKQAIESGVPKGNWSLYRQNAIIKQLKRDGLIHKAYPLA